MEPLCSSTILSSLPGSETQLAVAGKQLNQREKVSTDICCRSKINCFCVIGKRLKLGHAVETVRQPADAFTDTSESSGAALSSFKCADLTADVVSGNAV